MWVDISNSVAGWPFDLYMCIQFVVHWAPRSCVGMVHKLIWWADLDDNGAVGVDVEKINAGKGPKPKKGEYLTAGSTFSRSPAPAT